MFLSYNWLKKFVDFDLTPAELEKVLTMLGIEIESSKNYSAKYEGFVIGKVLESSKHPNADKLSVCKTDVGGEIKSIVCGAPNVAAGQKVVVGLVGATIPQSGAKLKKAKIRGEVSEGMICSQAELELGDDASGIWVLDDDAPVGEELRDYLELNDWVFEASLTPNKADCLSHLGAARDLAAYLGLELKYPEIRLKESDRKIEESISVEIEAPDKCERYAARIVRNAKIKESPAWLKSVLVRVGLRPINAVVDAANFVMLELGQPLHTFDLDKLEGDKIICKTPKDGEKFITLDGKERILDSEMLAICDARKVVAIGGVMGGENSEIDRDSTNILIESAYFNPTSIRRTSKKLGIQSDASYRFERGVDIENVLRALDRAASLIAEITGGEIDEGVIDVYPNPKKPREIIFRPWRANEIIGIELSEEKQLDILKRLGFKILESDEKGVLTEVPSWRADVFSEIDLIEEIARLYNYDNIEPKFFGGKRSRVEPPANLAIPKEREAVADYLTKNGFNEIVSQNIIDPKSARMFSENLIEIANPLGEELSVMRPAVLPSVLKIIEKNARRGNKDLRLFELGRSFELSKNGWKFIENHKEKEELVVAITGSRYPKQWANREEEADYYDIKGIAEDLFEFFGIEDYKFAPNEERKIYSKNSVSIIIDGKRAGTLGELSSEILAAFGLEKKTFALEIDAEAFYKAKRRERKHRKVSPYPPAYRDLAFVVDKSVPAEKIAAAIEKKGGKFLKKALIFDVYEGAKIGEGKKNLAFSLSFSAPDRTLTDEEIDRSIEKIIAAVEKEFDARLRKF